MKNSGRWLIMAALVWVAGGASGSERPPVDGASVAEIGPFVRDWRWSVVGYGPGIAGMEIVDVDGGGGRELVASGGIGTWGSPQYWYILRWNGSGYEQTWSSAHSAAILEALTVAQADGDPQLEVVVITGVGFTAQ